ncbi:amidohydrolase [Pseudochrobactrum lubricantis]|uniref:amidohydrolase n=1 Tax=Pseudochrobactrum lubricantis TaxID=558172 RepID=UPI0035E0946B
MEYADLVLAGGRIFCGLNEGFVEALAIADGKVLATGTTAEIEALTGEKTRRVDLGGRVAVPGLNDAHMHLLMLGIGMNEINLRPESGVRSLEEIFKRIAQEVAVKPAGEWIRGGGYDHFELSEQRHPTIEELDAIAPDHPVYITRTCGHVGIANSAAMRLANITHDTPSPSGGLIEKRNGKLSGLLAESGMRVVTDKIPPLSRDELKAAITRAAGFMLSQGFTSVMDAAVGMGYGMEELHAYEELASAGELPIRTWVCIYGNHDGIGDQAYEQGFRAKRQTGNLRYGAMKVFSDGSAGGLTAAMSEPYVAGDPNNFGIFCYSDAEMHKSLKHYHELGYQLAIHAIGDAAIEQVLSGIENADSAEQPIKARRHRIEHCGFLSDGQIERMAKAGIDPVPQPMFIYEFGDLYVANLGKKRAHASYPMRKWVDAGLHPAASSDAPVTSTNPFQNIYTLVTRKTKVGSVIGGDQCLTREEAIHAYTHFGAYTQFAENETGRLVAGMAADVAVLSKDIFTCDVEEIRSDVVCDMTVLDGKVVFERQV